MSFQTEASDFLSVTDKLLGEFETGFKINKYVIDDELVQHAEFLKSIGLRHADAVSYRDEAKAHFDATKAQLDQKLRHHHTNEGEKFTEASLAAEILTHPLYQGASNLHAAWNDRVNRWRVLWESALARTDMLKSLGQLYISGMWADRGIHGEQSNMRSAKAEAVKEGIAKARERRTVPDE